MKNTSTHYGAVSRLLHWLIAFAIIGLMIVGSYMEGLPDDHAQRCAWPCRGGLGAPIAGDTLYAQGKGADRLCLHADMLAFFAPDSGQWLKFESPAPF